jgi:hypothetical protein
MIQASRGEKVHMADMPQSGSEEFASRMFWMWNEAGLALMVSVGHRTGLFDAMATLPASTSAEIAASAGLNERYVREWLGAMSTGRIVDYQADRETYSLPAEHAAWLTRSAGLNNLATGTQFIRCSAPSKTRSWSVSGMVAACPIRPFRASRPSWQRTATRCTMPR